MEKEKNVLVRECGYRGIMIEEDEEGKRSYEEELVFVSC